MLRRGLYYVPPSPVPPHGIPLNPYAVAATMTPDAVLSHHTALDFHGCSHAVWFLIQYTAVRPSRPVPFSPCLFYGTRTLVALLRAQAADFGVVDAAAVQASGLARTLVAVLDRPDLGGGTTIAIAPPSFSFTWARSMKFEARPALPCPATRPRPLRKTLSLSAMACCSFALVLNPANEGTGMSLWRPSWWVGRVAGGPS